MSTTIRLREDGPKRYRNAGTTWVRGEAKPTDDDHAERLLETDYFIADEDSAPTCAEGDCSRTVDEEGKRCWQHDSDPDDDEG